MNRFERDIIKSVLTFYSLNPLQDIHENAHIDSCAYENLIPTDNDYSKIRNA